MKRRILISFATVMLAGALTGAASAQDIASAASNESYSHPELPAAGPWSGVVIILILILFFLPAAVIGPIVRALGAEEIPELHNLEEQDSHHASQHEPGHTIQSRGV